MPFRTISVAVTAETAGAVNGLRQAESALNRFENTTRQSSNRVSKSTGDMATGFTNLENIIGHGVTRSMTGFVSAAVGGYAAGRALNAALQDIIGGAVQFQARMLNVNSISHLTGDQLNHLSGQVLNLSKQLPQSANTLAEGLYDIASSGFQGAQGVQVLTASAKAATAGLTDTATSARAISGVLNAYGEGAGQARAVSDSLFQTVNVGVLSFQDLAQGIGAVIGTAAAAKVDVDQLGAAIATLTRAGQVPAEAFTNLNDLLAQIIQPSVTLANLFHKLGYESGAAALQSKGLQGVMQDIQHATGGDITSLAQLFTSIRALRGATGLLTNAGNLYAQSVQAQEAAHKGLGATADTLNVQLQSVSAQWGIFKNRAEAVAISAGTDLLPVMNAAIHVLEDLGSVLAHDGVKQTVEFATALYGASLAFRALRAIAGSDFIATLLRTAGLHAENAVAITAEGAAATRTAAELEALSVAETSSATSSGRLSLGLSGFGRAGIAATVLFTVAQGVKALENALHPGPNVDRLTNSLVELMTTGRLVGELPKTFGDNLKDLGSEIRRVVDPSTMQRVTDVAGSIVHVGGLLGSAHQDLDEAHKDFNALDQSLTALVSGGHADAAKSVFSALAAAANSQGVSTKDLNSLLPKYNQSLADTATQAKLAADGTSTNAQALDKQTQAAQRATAATREFVKSAVDETHSAFTGSFDIVAQFQPTQGQQAIQDAQQKLLDANRSLREEQARYDAEKTHSVSSDQALARSHRDVTDATTALAKAQADAAKTGDLATIYRQDISSAHQFVNDAHAAILRGLDPTFIARLLKEGPERAGPVLAKIVSDHSDRLITLANQSEKALDRISEQAIRIARLTNKAIAPGAKDRMAGELADAVRLQTLLKNAPAVATGQWLADQLGLKPAAIRRIANDFGINLSTFIQQTLDKHPVHVKVHGPAAAPGQRRTPDSNFAAGGLATGPGTGTSDSIPAWLSNGEYVVRASVVQQPGMLPYLNALNRFADGGYVGAAPATSTVAPKVIVQPVIVRHETNIGELRPHNYDEFAREVATRHRTRRAVER